MKAYGIPGRPRLFEVLQKIREVNAERQKKAPGQAFTGASAHAIELEYMPQLKVDFVTAVPRMALYLEYSGRIYDIYLKYAAPEDIHVFTGFHCDVTMLHCDVTVLHYCVSSAPL